MPIGGIRFDGSDHESVHADLFVITSPGFGVSFAFRVEELPAPGTTPCIWYNGDADVDDHHMRLLLTEIGTVQLHVIAGSDTLTLTATGSILVGATNILTYTVDDEGGGATPRRYRIKLNGHAVATQVSAIQHQMSGYYRFAFGRSMGATPSNSASVTVQQPWIDFTSYDVVGLNAFDDHNNVWDDGNLKRPGDEVEIDELQFAWTFEGEQDTQVTDSDLGLSSDAFNFDQVNSDGSGPVYGEDLFEEGVGIMVVTPSADFESVAVEGFVTTTATPATKVYRIQNVGDAPLSWTITDNVTWVNYTSTAGTLSPQQFTDVTFSFNGAANALAAGEHVGLTTFTNTTNGNGDTTREVHLEIPAVVGDVIVSPTDIIEFSGTAGSAGSFNKLPTPAIEALNDTGGTTVVSVDFSAEWAVLVTSHLLGPDGYELDDQEVLEIRVSLDEQIAAALPTGLYSAIILIRDFTHDVTAAIIDVTLEVGAPSFDGRSGARGNHFRLLVRPERLRPCY